MGRQLQRLTDSEETKPKCCSRNTLVGEAEQRLLQHFTLPWQRRSSINLFLTRYKKSKRSSNKRNKTNTLQKQKEQETKETRPKVPMGSQKFNI